MAPPVGFYWISDKARKVDQHRTGVPLISLLLRDVSQLATLSVTMESFPDTYGKLASLLIVGITANCFSTRHLERYHGELS